MRHHHELTREEEKTRHLFKKFQVRHKKTYANNMEENVRYRIFKSNLFKIQQLNDREQGTGKYGITEFADLTLGEYRQRTGLLPHHERHASHENEIRNAPAEIPVVDELPTEFDWRDKGVITQVKNQGNCGSCWAFSVVGNIEGLNAIKTGQLEEYSEQELLDCDTVDKACGGGFMDQAYKALEQLGGLELESEYPYVAKKEKACNFNKTMSHVAVAGAVDLPKNETAMAAWLVKNGPISIGVNANAMQFYRGGISHPWHPLCSKKQLDHGVLIVG
jgi:cathepsin F